MKEFVNTFIDIDNPFSGMVKGCCYAAEFFNGAIFDFWAGRKLSCKEARQAALIIANGSYNPPIYVEEDIVSVRKSR